MSNKQVVERKRSTPWFRILIVLWLFGLGAAQERQRAETAALRTYLEQQQQQQAAQTDAINDALAQIAP